MADESGARESMQDVGRGARRVAEELRQGADDAAERAAEELREGAEQARRFGRDASRAARRGYAEGRDLSDRNVGRQPLLGLLMVAALGYLLAWLLHGRR